MDEEEDEGQEEVKQEHEMEEMEDMEEEVGEGGGSRDGGGAAGLCTSCRTLFSLFSQAVLTREERVATITSPSLSQLKLIPTKNTTLLINGQCVQTSDPDRGFSR